MTVIDRLLAECVSPDVRGSSRLRLAAPLQGFPETAHGGGLMAAFDLIATRWITARTARTISAQIQKSIPLTTPLLLTAQGSATAVNFSLRKGGSPLAGAAIKTTATEPTPFWKTWSGPSEQSLDFPTARGCLACGRENSMGLRVQLRFDDRWVWAEYHPSETYRTSQGQIAPALYTVLLDEMAWWLGALGSGEAGVTTEITITLHRPNYPFDGAVLALGPRDRVAAADRRGHFWTTETAILAPGGALLASGAITFAGSRVYSKRLIPSLLRTNSQESLRPIFPSHVP